LTLLNGAEETASFRGERRGMSGLEHEMSCFVHPSGLLLRRRAPKDEGDLVGPSLTAWMMASVTCSHPLRVWDPDRRFLFVDGGGSTGRALS
jgi:hypothetical protein